MFKVYGQAAKSIVWLEGHVKKHLGPKPYYCIFPECTSRFASQDLLQKHVDNHFTEAEQPHKVVKKVDVNIAKKTDKKPANRRLRGTEKCLRMYLRTWAIDIFFYRPYQTSCQPRDRFYSLLPRHCLICWKNLCIGDRKRRLI